MSDPFQAGTCLACGQHGYIDTNSYCEPCVEDNKHFDHLGSRMETDRRITFTYFESKVQAVADKHRLEICYRPFRESSQWTIADTLGVRLHGDAVRDLPVFAKLNGLHRKMVEIGMVRTASLVWRPSLGMYPFGPKEAEALVDRMTFTRKTDETT